MFDGAMIDVVIGVAALFFVASLAASAIVETIGGVLHRRSKNLWDTIDLMLGRARLGADEERVVDLLYRQPFVSALVRPTAQPFFRPDDDGPVPVRSDSAPLRGAVGLDRSLTTDERRRRFYGPHLLPARDFADSLIEVVRPGGTAEEEAEGLRSAIRDLPAGDLRDQLDRVLTGAGDTMVGARLAIEGWYERHMELVSVWYRKQTRWFLFLAGLGMAVSLNLDAVDAATTLYRDDDVRTAVLEQAEAIVGNECTAGDGDGAVADVECLRDELGGAVSLPIGWSDVDGGLDGWSLRVLGWIMVAGSVTVGAPFWFDLLRRVLAVRRRT
ncbi:MAG: hypothetical protein AAFZ07_28500 [Actinomycetota bacterium]